MTTPISVSTLNNRIKSLLEATFLSVTVEGEVSRVTYHSSGHLYFTLKDGSSSISCVMFKGNNQKLKFRLEEGINIVVYGSISVYTPRGSYQINCFSLEPSGSGALSLAFEQLKKKLSLKGYFSEDIKKSIPKFPKTIAVVTSKTGAALQDMLRVAKKRWPLIKIILIDTIVQGESAANSIANGIKKADSLKADIIVIGRGGGSLEDLWGFNEEIVADAIHEANTPIVSAVGHEIDFMISDFTADLRAPTPSAAFEMILPDKDEYFMYIDDTKDRYDRTIKNLIIKKQHELQYIYNLLKQNSLSSKITYYQKEVFSKIARMNEIFSDFLQKKEYEVQEISKNLILNTSHIIENKQKLLSLFITSYESNNPQKRVKKGFAQIIKNGKITNLEEINTKETFYLLSKDTKLKAKAIDKKSL